MTGFGAGRGEAGGETVSVELRAVNAKFCEVKARLPRELMPLEPELVKSIKARISRGVIDAFVRRETAAGRVSAPRAALSRAAAYATALRELKDSLGLAGEPPVQDLALFADRTDVAEELTRLASHLAQARGLIRSEAPAGRKLEFLVQELNREINTIGSKSQHASIAATVVELKAELERIREQVQNVE